MGYQMPAWRARIRALHQVAWTWHRELSASQPRQSPACDLPVLSAQVARQALLDRDLDFGANQTSADSKEGGRLGLGRMNHRIAAMLLPDLG